MNEKDAEKQTVAFRAIKQASVDGIKYFESTLKEPYTGIPIKSRTLKQSVDVAAESAYANVEALRKEIEQRDEQIVQMRESLRRQADDYANNLAALSQGYEERLKERLENFRQRLDKINTAFQGLHAVYSELAVVTTDFSEALSD